MDRAEDYFWSIQERERRELEQLERDMLSIQAQIDVARRVEVLRHAPGFQDFLVAVQGLHALAREKLVGDESYTNEGLREARGRVRGLESVLALLTKPTVADQLAQDLAQRKNQLAEALRRRPKPKQESSP